MMQGFGARIGIAGELLSFLWTQRLWWMIPLTMSLLLVAGMVAFATAVPLGPFIYVFH